MMMMMMMKQLDTVTKINMQLKENRETASLHHRTGTKHEI